MTDRDHRRWLLKQLPDLEARGIVDAPGRERLASHFAAESAPQRGHLAFALSAAGGALLVGLGTVLLLAHNWESWSRPTRSVVSFAVLVLTQLLSAWVLWRRPDGGAWREATALAQSLAVAASTALVGQTWHLYGDLGGFVLVWMMLSLPLVYLMHSSAVAALYLGGIGTWTWWAAEPAWYLALLAAVAPFLAHTWRVDRPGRRTAGLALVLLVSLMVALPPLGDAQSERWLLGYAALFATALLANRRWHHPERPLALRPLSVVGQLGIAALAVVLSFEALLGHLHPFDLLVPTRLGAALLVGGLLIATLVLWLAAARHRATPHTLVFGAAPAVVAFGGTIPEGAALVVFNGYAVALAVVAVHRGLGEERLGHLNFGLLIASALVGHHFVWSDLPYAVRGLAFLAVGAIFLAGNLLARRRRLA